MKLYTKVQVSNTSAALSIPITAVDIGQTPPTMLVGEPKDYFASLEAGLLRPEANGVSLITQSIYRTPQLLAHGL